MNRSLFYIWNFYKHKNWKKAIVLNFGPQHPAAHGVLRLILQLEGEIIQRLDPHIGLLHRGTETLMQTKHYEQNIPYFDRLDYVSMMSQEHVYCLLIEQILQVSNLNLYTNYIRILFDELTRLLNHFLAIACHALDIGSMSSVFWGFEEREKLMEFYERVCGARMHAAFHRPNIYFSYNLTFDLLRDILLFIQNCFITLNEMHNVLTYNKIWKQRLINIATLSLIQCQQYGLTGVLARSTGLQKDLRLASNLSYSNYNSIFFKSFIGCNGDTFDRYLIRMLEMGESLNICNNIILKLLNFTSLGNYFNITKIYNTQVIKKELNISYSSMENLIEQFMRWHTGIYLPQNQLSVYIESPKGEFGLSLISNFSTKPQKCKIRSPSYFNLQALSLLTKGHYLADLATIIGTIDIVFGEIDK